MGSPCSQGNLAEKVNKLVLDFAVHKRGLSNATKSFEEMEVMVESLQQQVVELTGLVTSLTTTVTALQDEVKELQLKNHTVEQCVSVRGGNRNWPSGLDVPMPAQFNGSRDSNAIENFLYQVENYLDLQNVIAEDLRLDIAALLLDGDALAWWRLKSLDMENGKCKIDTFDAFKRELRNYFMPQNATRKAYRMLMKLKHTGPLEDYVRAFQHLMLEVPEMTDHDKLNWFIVGLQPWAQYEVERDNPKVLEDAYVTANHLVDIQYEPFNTSFKLSKKPHHGSRRGGQRDNKCEPSSHRNSDRKPFFQKNNYNKDKVVTCWVCGGRHKARHCSHRLVKDKGRTNTTTTT